MSLEGRIENGHVVFDQPVALPEGTPVRVEPLLVAPPVPERQRSWLESLGEVVGTIHDWPEDLALNHDHYLYGAPKKA